MWIISCSQLIESCRVPAAAALDAADKIGWQAQVVDGQLSDAAQADGINQAVAAGADGVLLVAVDCSKVASPLAEARAKGIKVVGLYAFDCNDPALAQPGPPLFDGSVGYGRAFPSYADISIAWGRVKAAYVIAKTHGTAKVINLVDDDYLVLHYIEQGFASELATCKGCSVVDTVNFVQSDLLDGRLEQSLAASVQRHPEATVVHVPIDPLFALAVNAATKGKNLLRVGGEALPANMDFIRQGLETAAVAFPHVWIGWAGVDTMNRLFAGERAAQIPDSGIGWQLVDGTHNLPQSGPSVPQVHGTPVDFAAAYERVWGV